MKYPSIFIFCLLAICVPLFGQATFSISIDKDENSETGISILQLEDGSYVISSGCLMNPSWHDCLHLLKTNSIGNVLWNKQYDFINGGFRGNLIQTKDGGFAIATWDYVTLENTDALLMRFDSKGDTLWTKMYGGSKREIGYRVAELNNGDLMLIGRTEEYGNSDIYLVKIDAFGQVIWEQIYGGIESESAISLHPQPDATFLITGFSRSNPMSNSTGFWMKIDSLGNELWSWMRDTYQHKNSCRDNSLPSPLGGYIINSCEEDTIFFPKAHPRPSTIGKTDSLGNYEWKVYFPNRIWAKPIWNHQVLPDGSTIVVGLDETNFPAPYQFYGSSWMAKISAEGVVEWERNYIGDLPGAYFLYAVTPTQDGGFAATGRYRGNEGDVWLLKVDSRGCVIPGCEDTLIQVTNPFIYTDIEEVEIGGEEVFVQVSPNPIRDQAVIQYHIPKDGTLRVYDYQGKEIRVEALIANERKLLLEVGDWASGVYLYQLEIGGERLDSGKLVVE